MHTISVANHKGGSGKTTTAVNLAACLSEMQYQVMLVDLDPQSHASLSFGRRMNIPFFGRWGSRLATEPSCPRSRCQ